MSRLFYSAALAACVLATPLGPVRAQITDLKAGPGTVGERTARSSVNSDAALQRAEKEAARVRKADEARYKRRDEDMRRSLGGICRGC